MAISCIPRTSFFRNLCGYFTKKPAAIHPIRTYVAPLPTPQLKNNDPTDPPTTKDNSNSSGREASYTATTFQPISSYQISPQPRSNTLSTTFLEKRPRLLIADDERSCRKIVLHMAITMGFEPENITVCQNLEEARIALAESYLEKTPFQVIFSDRDMGSPTDGDRLAEEVKTVDPSALFILISGSPPEKCPPDMDKIYVKGKYKAEDLVRYLESTVA
jgi:hypothetical protein